MGKKGSNIDYLNNTGGMDLLVSLFSKLDIWKSIDKTFGKRHGRAVYSYSDAIKTSVLNTIVGSRRLEHMHEHRHKLLKHPAFKKGMSPDTVSRLFKHLAVDNIYYDMSSTNKRNQLISDPSKLDKKTMNEININMPLNNLMLDTAISLGLLQKDKSYELDIDATIINTRVSDCRFHYKQDFGYSPMVVFLGGIPIFLESRNGNSSPMLRVSDILENALELIEKRGIGIDFVRIDGAGANKFVVDLLCRKKIRFLIRAKSTIRTKMEGRLEWKTMEDIKYLKCAETHVMIDTHRIRAVNYLKHGSKYEQPMMWAIITNDEGVPQEEVIRTYNMRGSIEQRFSDLNEMGWNYMVHRELKYNTVHMMMTMIAYLFFVYAKKKIAEKVTFVKETFRPKTFIKKFIIVFTTWIDDEIRFVSRQKEYAPLTGFV